MQADSDTTRMDIQMRWLATELPHKYQTRRNTSDKKVLAHKTALLPSLKFRVQQPPNDVKILVENNVVLFAPLF